MEKVVQKKSIDSVDFFKGVAMLLVVLVHSIQRFSVPYWFAVIPSLGQLGCQVFFALSSFLLCFGYADKEIKYVDFVKRRISKLIVGYWTMIFFYLFLNIFFAFIHDESIVSILTNPGLYLNFLFLHGFSLDKGIVNGIVRGGWFVGTITVLYMLFPLLLKFYNISNSKWIKVRKIVFPLITYIISCSFFCLLIVFKDDYVFENNSVSYFSFLNQLPCFALGFSFYDIYKNNDFSSVKYPLIKFFACSAVSLFCFFTTIENALIFMSLFVALSFVYLFVWTESNKSTAKIINSDFGFVKIIKKFGRISFSVYLTHPIIVHLLVKPIIEFLSGFYNNHILLYLLLCPFMFVLSYFVAVLFKWYESKVYIIVGRLIENLKRRCLRQGELNNENN